MLGHQVTECNNEGSLTFGYSLEDTDLLEGGAYVFNGQNSVLWNNVRDAFPSEIVQMYQTLRSAGILSYASVSKRFTDHQAKWPEAIFNEDAWFKYITPLTNPDPGKDPTAVYLPMLQGSKAEQRKWWLYNRFRYMDSKWNAGDALTDVIQLRGYAKANITVTPYADIYPTVKYGSYLVAERGHRGQPTLLTCPLDAVNDTEIYIYSASQLASVGDLSGLKVGFADFSKAVKLQSIKVGSDAAGYVNQNLTELSVGNSKLLHTVDARNCAALTGSIDLSGASNIKTVLLQGTSATSVSLPVGGVLETLRLPSTIANLTIRDQGYITLFTIEGGNYDTITTLRIENCGDAIPIFDILDDMAAGSRVRLIGISTEIDTIEDVVELYDKFDLMSGLDETGGNVDGAVVSGQITGVASARRKQLNDLAARYPNVTIECAFVKEGSIVRFYNGNTMLQYLDNVLPGETATYTGETPVHPTNPTANEFIGWYPSNENVTDETNCYAQYHDTESIVVKYLEDRLEDFDSGDMEMVGQYAFDGSTGLKNVRIRGGEVCRYAFRGTNLDSLVIDDGATIDGYAFNSATVSNASFGNFGTLPSYAFNRTTFENDVTVTADTVGSYALQSIHAPNMTVHANVIREFAFYDLHAERLTVSANSLWYNAFDSVRADVLELSCPASAFSDQSLMYCGAPDVIIRGDEFVFANSYIRTGYAAMCLDDGAIYVNDDLVDTYKAYDGYRGVNNHVKPNTFPVSQYPVRDKSTITDSWAEIIAACGSGTHASKYSIGDKKLLELSNGEHVYMHLVAMDTDNLANGAGKAPTTWLAGEIVPIYHRMNPDSRGTTGGWMSSELRSYLGGTVLGYLPNNLRSAIKSVKKVSQTVTDSGLARQETNDRLWIPSSRELGFNNATYEADAHSYYDAIVSTYGGGGSSTYGKSYNTTSIWTRTVLSGSSSSSGTWYSFLRTRGVRDSGTSMGSYTSYEAGVLIGFCI